MSIDSWAQSCFGAAALGDRRRSSRLVRMAGRAARSPGGRISEVFRSSAERQAAYDFLEHDMVAVDGVASAMCRATAHASRHEVRVLVPLDGTSLSLADHAEAKGFGRVGNYSFGGQGLKLINALALRTDGVPIGVAEQVWWSRQVPRPRTKKYRHPEGRESAHWRTAVDRISTHFATCAPNTKVHFLADREGDAALLIRRIVDAGHEFTIRANSMRKTMVGRRRCALDHQLGQLPVGETMHVTLPATPKRAARVATLEIRSAWMPMVMADAYQKARTVMNLRVVWAHEPGPNIKGGRINWLLYTNLDGDAASAVVERYSRRWRIEEFHRTWKSGLCRVEDNQLRSRNAVIKWATILAAVAARADRLRQRARVAPEDPATTELTVDELEALVILKQQDSPRATITPVGLTLEKAIRWIADLGGYVGAKSSGPPGAVTIGRGLQRLEPVAAVLGKLRRQGRLR